jgi:CRISPR-associated endonuclease/helicase Cas3
MLAPFGVGTVDQALLAALPSRHQTLRLIGLSQKVLIIDEVHAYDIYMNRILSKLLQFHAAQGGSAILLSATIPAAQRAELSEAFAAGLVEGGGEAQCTLTSSAFPLATRVGAESVETDIESYAQSARQRGDEVLPLTRHEVAVELEDDRERCIDQLVEAARGGGCACWIRNTVGEAIEAYESLAAIRGSERLILFHARFTAADRQSIEELVLEHFGPKSTREQRAGYIVVATQVIEQSLDLDFDFMVTDLAPVDLVIQRAGRLQRHERGERDPRLVVYGPDPEGVVDEKWYQDFFDGAQYVYRAHDRLWLTAHTLARLGRIRIPGEARLLVESVYGEAAEAEVPEALADFEFEAFVEQLEHENMAEFNALHFAMGYGSASSGRWFEDVHTPTRLGDPSVTLRLARVEEDGSLSPWSTDARHPWRLSELNLRVSSFSKVAPESVPDDGALRAARASMRDRGEWSELVPLRRAGDGIWQCAVIDGYKRPRQLVYSHDTGLQLHTEEI